MDFTTVPAGSSSCAGENKEKRGGGSKRSSNSSNSSGNKGVRLSTDPQSIAARERRHRISDRFKILQSLVPGGTRMDTVSMLEEAIHYVKFLKTQIWLHQTMMTNFTNEDHDPPISSSLPFAATSSSTSSHHLPPPLHQSLYTSNLPAAAVLPAPSTTPSSLPPYIYQGDEAGFYREFHSSNY